MKINKLIYLFAFIGMIGFTSCEEEELTGAASLADLLFLNDSTVSTGEADAAFTIVVYRSTSDFSQALTANVSVSAEFATTTSFANAGDDATGTFTVDKTTVSFASGVSSDTITFTPIDDLLSSGVKNVTLTISEPSISSYSIGTDDPSSLYGSVTVEIADDDCPVGFDFTGAWTYTDATGIDSFPGSLLCGNFAFCTGAGGTVTLTSDATDPTGTTAIITGGPFGSPYSIKFLTCSAEITALGSTTSFAGVTAWNMQQGSTGVGSFSSARITIVGVLGTNGDFEMELTR